MYGVIGSSVLIGIVLIQLIKRFNIKSIDNRPIVISPKQRSSPRYLFGGIIFGLGWALTGACPGPMFILLGSGMTIVIIMILSAVLGTYVYGLLRDKLPH